MVAQVVVAGVSGVAKNPHKVVIASVAVTPPAKVPRVVISAVTTAFTARAPRVVIAGVGAVTTRKPRVVVTTVAAQQQAVPDPALLYIRVSGQWVAPLVWIRAGGAWVDAGGG